MTTDDENKGFEIDFVTHDKEVMPFPVRLVDLSGATTVTLPEEHIGIRQQAPADELMSSMHKTGIWNVIQFSQDDMDQKLRMAANLIQDPKAFLENPTDQIFGAGTKKQMKPGAFGERRWTFRASYQKNYVLNMISGYLRNIQGAKPIAETVCFVADELFTNSLYNAPFSDSDYTLDRSTVVFIDPKFSSEMIISHNTKRLFIGCLDYFGSFNCEEFLMRMSKSFTINVEALKKDEVGGAGIGMLRIIDLAPEIFVVVEKNKRTFVGCSFPLNTSLKNVRKASRNFFFQSFESFDSANLNIRVEKRGTKTMLRCYGTFDDQAPLKNIDFVGVSEIVVVLHLVKGITGDEFENSFTSLTQMKALKKVCFDYVPVDLLPDVEKLKAKAPKLFEIRSVFRTANCSGCKTLQNVIYRVSGDTNAKNLNEPFLCPTCSEKSKPSKTK